MAFAGDLQTFDLFDLLGWLMSRKKAGKRRKNETLRMVQGRK